MQNTATDWASSLLILTMSLLQTARLRMVGAPGAQLFAAGILPSEIAQGHSTDNASRHPGNSCKPVAALVPKGLFAAFFCMASVL